MEGAIGFFVLCVAVMTLLALNWSLADCYDPLDPAGNITVTFDINQWTDDGYMASVRIQNYYQYRHVERPGWKLGWTWEEGEVIWSIASALATQQGNCSTFKSRIPHSCKRDPTIIDLMPNDLGANTLADCCRGGLLSAWAIDQQKSFSSFQLVVGNLPSNTTSPSPPRNVTLMAPGRGYTCSSLEDDPPTIVEVVGGRREEQVFRTWKSTCTYSAFVAKQDPTCCVSMSTFYNPSITPCPACNCGCQQEESTSSCTRLENAEEGNDMRCIDHKCPIRVHWHIKANYRDYWRVKLAVSNYDHATNYSDWNVVVQHPGFRQSMQAYSFNFTRLHAAFQLDEVILFWGLDYYNRELLQAGDQQPGSVMTEILLEKDKDLFTFRNGWALPRRIYFNGEYCNMPLPDDFPGLPNAGSLRQNACQLYTMLTLLILLLDSETIEA